MTKETWNKFHTEAFLDKFFPDDRKFNTWLRDFRLNKIRWTAVKFIENLLRNNVSLDVIDINDFNCNTRPSVYVGRKRYSRLAKNDYKLALKHLKKYGNV